MTDGTNDGIKRGEDGRPMLQFDSMDDEGSTTGEGGEPVLSGRKDSETFNINDRSDENQQRAVDSLKKEFGSGYQAAVKNAQAVLLWADEDYPKSLEHSGLGSYPPLIKALDKLGHELEAEYKEANNPGSMRDASLKAFRDMARERINHLITRIEAEYISKHGAITKS